jgi:hypothetical protein
MLLEVVKEIDGIENTKSFLHSLLVDCDVYKSVTTPMLERSWTQLWHRAVISPALQGRSPGCPASHRFISVTQPLDEVGHVNVLDQFPEEGLRN